MPIEAPVGECSQTYGNGRGIVTTGVNHITLAVSNLQRAIEFYAGVVGCAKMATWTRGAYLRAGDMWVCLALDQAASAETACDYTHIAFGFDPPGLAEFRARLSAFGGVEWKVNSSEGDSVYFLDPDGRRLEAHVGDLESRLESLRESPYEGLALHALYYHFPSKLNLYAEVLDEVLAGLRAIIAQAALRESPERRLHELVKNYLEFGMRERNLVNALVVNLAPEDADLRSRVLHSRKELAGQMEPIVREIIATSSLSARTDARGLTGRLVALMDGLLVEYSFLDQTVDPQEVADQVLAVLDLLGVQPASA